MREGTMAESAHRIVPKTEPSMVVFGVQQVGPEETHAQERELVVPQDPSMVRRHFRDPDAASHSIRIAATG